MNLGVRPQWRTCLLFPESSNERNHNIDKLFHESLGGQKIEPAPAVWGSLASQVPAHAGRRGTLLYLIAAVLIGAFTFFMHNSLPGDAETEYSPLEVADTPAAEIKNVDEQPAVIEADEPVQVSSDEETINTIENTNQEIILHLGAVFTSLIFEATNAPYKAIKNISNHPPFFTNLSASSRGFSVFI